MPDEIRCLSVRQPWAWAIVSGLKDVENRSWTTAYRGPVVIHAGANRSGVSKFLKADRCGPTPDFSFSALIGVVDLVDVEALSPKLEANRWALGPYCWRLANPRSFAAPISAKGQLNLYALPAELVDPIRRALRRAAPVSSGSRSGELARQMTHEETEARRASSLCASYLELGDGVNALRWAEREVALDGSPEDYVDRGIAKAQLPSPDLQGALKDLDLAISQGGRSARAFRVRSAVHRALGHQSKADADLKRAAALSQG